MPYVHTSKWSPAGSGSSSSGDPLLYADPYAPVALDPARLAAVRARGQGADPAALAVAVAGRDATPGELVGINAGALLKWLSGRGEAGATGVPSVDAMILKAKIAAAVAAVGVVAGVGAVMSTRERSRQWKR